MSDLQRKILDASLSMVAEQGVRSVSFREVARRAGVSHQAPYHHFGNYQGILRAIADEGFRGLADAMEEAGASAGGDSLAAIVEAGIAYVRFARDHVGHFRVMFQPTLMTDADDDAPPLAEAERTHAVLVRLATAAAADGHGRGLPGEQVAHLCWSIVHGFATLLVEGILARKGTLGAEAEDRLTRQVVEALGGLLDARTRAGVAPGASRAPGG